MNDPKALGDFLSRAGLFNGVWRCYGCKVEVQVGAKHAADCRHREWFEQKDREHQEKQRWP